MAAALPLAGQWQAYGNQLYQKGDIPGAIAAYQKSLALDSSNQALEDFVTKISAQQSQESTPTQSMPDQAALDDLMDDAKNMMGESRFQEALENLKKIIKAAPSDASAYAALGDAYYGLGKVIEARQAYEKSLELDTAQPQVQSFVQNHLPDDVVNAPTLAKGDVNPFSPLWRSALIPGWGQVYNGDSTKGVVLGLTTLGLLAGAAATYLGAAANYQTYSALGPGTSANDFNTAYDNVESWALANHILTVIFYAAYVYNLGDAAAEARPKQTLRASLRLSPDGSPQLALDKVF